MAAVPTSMLMGDIIGVESFLPALGMKPEIAVFASAIFATVSVVVNFYGEGVGREWEGGGGTGMGGGAGGSWVWARAPEGRMC